jgi:hypothetical protein
MKLYSGKPEKAKTKHVFKNNDYYASVCTFREGHTITAEHRALMNAGKAERKARRLPHSDAKRITFKKIPAVSIRRKRPARLISSR